MRKLTALVRLLIGLILLLTSLPAFAEEEMPYYIRVDCYNNIVTVYSTKDDSVVRQMICSTGRDTSPTPLGEFVMPKQHKSEERGEWYTFEHDYGKYGSRIWGNFLFHSILYSAKSDDALEWNTYYSLGQCASHGCVRLYVEDAKWIAENCFAGTKVTIFKDSERHDYLKQLLTVNTFSVDNGSYQDFSSMAEREGELGYDSRGEEVTALENRLRELGLFAGEANDFYGADTVRCVKALQKALGRRENGVADEELRKILFSADAPTSLIAELSLGAQSEAVRMLQTVLKALGFYEGDETGIYDENTENAVRLCQQAWGYEANGRASAELQQNLLGTLYELDQMSGDLGFTVDYISSLQESAVVTSQKRLNLRADKSTSSAILDVVAPGTQVQVLDHGTEWTRISNGKATGYVYTCYLIFSEEETSRPSYRQALSEDEAVRVDWSRIPTLLEAVNADYGKVSTKERLRIRETADKNGTVLFLLMPNTEVRILGVEDGWAKIEYGGKTGYAKAEYFNRYTVTELTGETLTVVAP